MSAVKERFQNPVPGDDIRLRLFSYNSNNLRDFESLDRVEIYFLDPEEITETNKDGRRLVQTIPGDQITRVDVGSQEVIFNLDEKSYCIGQYRDVWFVEAEPGEKLANIENMFEVLPDLWFTTPIPPAYDFQFSFRPNKIRKGSKQFILVSIMPNMPKGTDLEKFYFNIAVVAPLKINIAAKCGPCLSEDPDLRTIIENEEVELREKTTGFYFLDTTDLEVGIYDVWFEMQFGQSLFVSDVQQLQIF